MKLLIEKAVFEPVTIEIPEKCPKCQADLTQKDALIEANLTDEYFFGTVHEASESMLGETHEFVTDGEHDGNEGNEYRITGYECANCNESLPVDDSPETQGTF